MNQGTTSPHPRPAPARRRRSTALAALLVAGLLSGCGVRLEAPPVAEPVPDTLEVVRRTAVSDALLVADRAETALTHVSRDKEALITELTRIMVDSESQADAFGGEYESGLSTDDPTITPQASASAQAVTAADVVDSLVDAAARSRTAAGTTTDGPLARLLASVGAAQTVSATRLAELVDVAGPDPVDPQVPVPDGADDPDTTTPTASPAPDEGTPTGDPSPADPDQPSSPPTADVAPAGLTDSQLSTLVAAEDETSYALRLRAAIADGHRRERLLARQDEHAERARAWALLAEVQDTGADPRRVAYSVPRVAEQGDPALVRTLEDDLATDYATLVATTSAGTRGVLVDLLVDSAVALDDWGATPSPFPGLPEQAEQ